MLLDTKKDIQSPGRAERGSFMEPSNLKQAIERTITFTTKSLGEFPLLHAIQAAKSLLLLLALENPVIYRIFPEMSSESADISLENAFFALAMLK